MNTKFRYSKRKMLVLIVALVLVLAVAGLAYKQLVKPVGQQHTAVTPQTAGKTSTNDTAVHAGPSHDSSPSPTVLPSNPSHPVTSMLAKPTGQILNVQTVSLSGATGMDSTCMSVPGATCFIQATMGSKVVKVSETKAIPDGSQGVELTWDAKQLSQGTWSVWAVAGLNGETASSDSYTLTVNK